MIAAGAALACDAVLDITLFSLKIVLCQDGAGVVPRCLPLDAAIRSKACLTHAGVWDQSKNSRKPPGPW
jgi:hypothetical protein